MVGGDPTYTLARTLALKAPSKIAPGDFVEPALFMARGFESDTSRSDRRYRRFIDFT